MKVITKVQNILPNAKYFKVDDWKPSKIHVKKKVPNTSCCLQLLSAQSSTSHTTITVPGDSKNPSPMRLNIDTNVDIIATTSRATLTYLLPRINACIILLLILLGVVFTNTWANHVGGLQANIDQMNHDIRLLAQDCHLTKVTLNEMIRRYGDSKMKHSHHVKHVVEREATSTMSYEYTDVLSDVSDGKDVDQSNMPLTEAELSEQPDLVLRNSTGIDAIFKNDANLLPVRFENSTGNEPSDIFENRDFADGDFSTDSDWEDSGSSINERVAREKRSGGRGILAAHFKGAFPETVVRDGGLVAPWYLDDSASGSFGLSRFNLREGKGAVQVTEPGLYYIYAQVYYLTNETMNSFWINVRSADKSVIRLALCSTVAWGGSAGEVSEVSCFTSTVRYLRANETVFVQQRERNRLVLMKEGQTFLGLVKFHSEKTLRKMEIFGVDWRALYASKYGYFYFELCAENCCNLLAVLLTAKIT